MPRRCCSPRSARPVTAPISPAAVPRACSPSASSPPMTTTRSSAKIADGVPNTADGAVQGHAHRAADLAARSRTFARRARTSRASRSSCRIRTTRSSSPRSRRSRSRSSRAGLETPWGFVFLPDGRLLVTERPGACAMIEKGKLLAEPVKGTPKVWVQQDAGMLDVAHSSAGTRRTAGSIWPTRKSSPGYVAPPPAPPRRSGGAASRRGAAGAAVAAARPVRRR